MRKRNSSTEPAVTRPNDDANPWSELPFLASAWPSDKAALSVQSGVLIMNTTSSECVGGGWSMVMSTRTGTSVMSSPGMGMPQMRPTSLVA